MGTGPLNRNVTRLKMQQKNRLFVLAGINIILIGFISAIALPRLNRRMVGEHQRGVIRELDRWADEYSDVTDDDSAVRAAGMIEYISNYYQPSDGYRSDIETEHALQDARQQAITRLSNALSAYTGSLVENPLDWSAIMTSKAQQIPGGG